MANRIVAGLVAGACGSMALTAAASIDALVRGEAPRWLPGEVGHKMADELGLPLDYDLESAQDAGGMSGLDVSDRIGRREEALGTLLSVANRLAIGLAYGLIRKVLPRPPWWLAGGALGGVSMVAGDYSAIWTDDDKPRRSTTDWLADVMPHAVYGTVTAVTFEAISGRRK